MGFLEIAVGCTALAGGYRGLRRGLIREGMALAGLVAGLMLAYHQHARVVVLLEPLVGSGGWVRGAAYLGILFLALGVATLMTSLLSRLSKKLGMGWLNGAGGALLGAAQGVLLASLVLFLVVKHGVFGLDGPLLDSDLALSLLGALHGVVLQLPEEMGPVTGFFAGAPGR